MLRPTIREILLLSRNCNSVASFEAYADESGTHFGAPYVFVGGVIAKQTSWEAISDGWASVLRKFGVETCRATDLNNFQGEFAGWDEDKRRSFYIKFFEVIKSESGLKSVGIGVECRVYDKVSEEFPDVRLTPYHLCAENWCAYVGAIAKRKKHWPPLAIYFEYRQQHDSPTFRHTQELLQSEEFRKKHNIRSIVWVEKGDAPPLQFADMFVYELYRLKTPKIVQGKPTVPRYPLQEFEKYVESNGTLLTEKEIREYFSLSQLHQRGHGSKYL